MKLSVLSLMFYAVATASAFTFSTLPSNTRSIARESTTARSLFGGKKDGSGDKKGPGFMDQMAMLKKAQEIATKKMAMDKELAQQDYVGEAAGGNVKVTVKYVPPLPMQQPGYEGSKVDIDEAYLQNASSEELSDAVAEALRDAYKKCTTEVAMKLAELTKDLGSMMGGMAAAQ